MLSARIHIKSYNYHHRSAVQQQLHAHNMVVLCLNTERNQSSEVQLLATTTTTTKSSSNINKRFNYQLKFHALCARAFHLTHTRAATGYNVRVNGQNEFRKTRLFRARTTHECNQIDRSKELCLTF